MNIENSIPNKVRYLMQRKNYSYSQLSAISGIPTSTLCNIGSGNTQRVAFITCEKLSRAFAIPIDYFLSESPIEIEV